MRIRILRRNWTLPTAALLVMIGGSGVVVAQQGGGASMGAGGMDHSGMDHGGMGQGGGMMGSGSGGMDHGGMDHGGMGHGGGMMGSGTGGMDHGAMGHGGGMMMGQMMCRTSEHIEGRLAYLKAELKLTDAQTHQWNAFADALRAAGLKVGQYCATLKEQHSKAMQSGILSQLGMMERTMTAHLEEVRTVKAAAEPLFGVLSDEQKKTAEQTMTGLMELGMGMGNMGMGMGKM
jgi:LTXXQ motif family protein